MNLFYYKSPKSQNLLLIHPCSADVTTIKAHTIDGKNWVQAMKKSLFKTCLGVVLLAIITF